MRLKSTVTSAAAAALLVALAGCKDSTPPSPPPQYDVSIQAGDGQIGLPSKPLSQPLQVVVSDPQTSDPVVGVQVQWKITQGSGGTLNPPTSTTDSSGIGRTTVTLGADTGTYSVQADVPTGVVTPVVFHMRAVAGLPDITSIQPQGATAGDTVTITGSRFGGSTAEVGVDFDGFTGVVVSQSDTQIRVVVPVCLPSRTVQVTVSVGTLQSGGFAYDVVGGSAGTVNLAVGAVLTTSAAGELSCLQLPSLGDSTRYLVAIQNAATVAGASMPFRLSAIASGGAAASLTAGVTPQGAVRTAASLAPPSGAPLPPQLAWEQRIRESEARDLRPGDFIRRPRYNVTGAATPQAVPSVGDTRQFNVINKDNTFTKVTAVVKYVGAHGIIYQDVNAPSNGFTASDFQRFSDLFDDPIYDTDVATYGGESDLDNNGHVIILFTPVVNELTPKGSTGFVAGFFYGNDLTTNNGSNHGEIFYSLVPDPDGKFGDAHKVSDLFQVVPPTLAHEFMHMIHFNQRVLLLGGFGLDALWLSEGLAHSAEDVVGQVFADRGDFQQAQNFQSANWTRAYYYLGSFTKSPDHTYDVSLLSSSGFGSLEQRGAAWLVIKYLQGQYGDTILKELVQTTLSSTDNVAAHTGRSWASTFNDWSVALYADNDPELTGASVDPRYSFPNIDLRRTIFSTNYGGFALQPATKGFTDFVVSDTLPASSPYLLIIDSGTSTQVLDLGLAPTSGGSFPANAKPQIAIMRLH